MKYKYLIILLITMLISNCKKNEEKLKGLTLQNYKDTDFKQLKINIDSSKNIKIPSTELYDSPAPQSLPTLRNIKKGAH